MKGARTLEDQENYVNQGTSASNSQLKIAETFEYQRPAVQTALFILWRVHNKKYQAGAQLFYEEINRNLKTAKPTYKEALAFLEGAGVVVNEVVVSDKVPTGLIQRYGILGNGWKEAGF